MEYILLGGSLLVLVFLLNFFINYKAYGKQEKAWKKRREKRDAAAAKGLLVNCPLCSSPLYPGEDLFTRVYRPMSVSDQLCIIKGCPHCYPSTESGIKRKCPVCHKQVDGKTGHLVAHLFNKTSDGKKHVVVSGCNLCCKSKLS